MRAEEVERYRDRWVAVRRSDEAAVADAGSLEELRATLERGWFDTCTTTIGAKDTLVHIDG